MRITSSIDWFLLLLCIIVGVFSSAVWISMDSFRFTSELLFFAIGFIIFIAVSLVDYRIYKSFTVLWYVLGLLLLISTFIFGRSVKGATRWVTFAGVSLQFSELVKPLLIIFFSVMVTKIDLNKWKNCLLYWLLTLPFLFLVFKQPDLGNTIIYFLIFIAIFFQGGGNLLFSGFFTVLSGIFAPIVWHFMKEYQKLRITSFLDPGKDPLGIGYNLLQAIITVGSGAFSGKGLGAGTQSRLRFLPERSTDFIFATVAEEVGFMGSLFILVVLFSLLWRIYIIGSKTENKFGQCLVFGSFMMIFSQVVINIGMNTGIMPITGVTLPLVSQGGSSIVGIMITLGIVSNISRKKGWVA